ncbi:hypothetical protein ACIBAG_28285 [Streptomyces sp. NPDC051243]|uniref:hypothetical protein n=1 Tax=Streptomyces sp. NPDC051243 TaxID=3365646 RepID=UPI00379C2521
MALDPARVERISALVAECRPLLDSDAGMAAVQQQLSDRGVSVMDSIIVTRELLGAEPTALGKAKGIVLSSPSRGVERQRHEELVDALLDAVDQVANGG